MSTHNNTSVMTRRNFLAKAASGAAATGLLTLGPRTVAFAASGGGKGDAVVQIFLKGGADGLSMLPPALSQAYGTYRDLRPNLAIPRSGKHAALPLTAKSSKNNASFSPGFDGVVALHPCFKPIYDTLWKEGTLALIPAVGTDEYVTRSHFFARKLYERGAMESKVQDGYLGRMVAQLSEDDQMIRSLSTSNGSQLVLKGDPMGPVTVPELSEDPLSPFNDSAGARDAIAYLNGGRHPLPKAAARAISTGMKILAVADSAAGSDGYPDSPLGQDLRDAALLLKSGYGVKAIAVDFNGWDHHANHGAPGSGQFWDQASTLAAAVRRFTDDLKSSGLFASTTIIVVSEFGRSIEENGNLGLDHGRAGSMMIMGGGIQGGVFGHDFYDRIEADPKHGDLTVLTDWREPVSEVLTRRARVDASKVFPTLNTRRRRLGLTRA